MKLKRVAEQLLPRPLLILAQQAFAGWQRAVDFSIDRRRYARYSMSRETVIGKLSDVQLEAQVTRDYHRIEKGLTLRNPRNPFGLDVAARLDALIPMAESRDPSSSYLRSAKTARHALQEWNAAGTVDNDVAPIPHAMDSSQRTAEFFTSRHSVRNFAPRAVSREALLRAVDNAAHSPSVCNRQPWKLRLFVDTETDPIRKVQYGNAGFGDTLPVVAVISVELSYFAGSDERNQAWIEGGIFASSLMWALHSEGLSSCMLNLSQTNSAARSLRKATNIPESEVPIMMMAIGYAEKHHRVARSPRRGRDILVPTRPSESS